MYFDLYVDPRRILHVSPGGIFSSVSASMTARGRFSGGGEIRKIRKIKEHEREQRVFDFVSGKIYAPGPPCLPGGVFQVREGPHGHENLHRGDSHGELWRPWHIDFSTYEMQNHLFPCIFLFFRIFRISPPPENLPRAVMEAVAELKTSPGETWRPWRIGGRS